MLSVALLNEMAAIAAELCAPEAYEDELFRVIERAIGADVVFFKRDGAPGPVVRGFDPQWLAAREQALFDCRQEVVEVLDAAREHGVAVDREVLGARRLEAKNYYQLLMKPTGGRCSALLPVSWRGQALSVLVLGRGGNFASRDLEQMQQLAPTLQLCEVSRRARLDVSSVALELARVSNAALRASAAQDLTAAEREVLSFLHLGYTNAEIACARGSTARTVRNQLSSAYAKLGVASRAEAVAALARLHVD
ncbi:MAG TPA: helix-turn-helix transcriptional regulator [Polyangiaceae bacterium]|jgi:DNA-binding CsgD family transcriptional regulator|nr:helix-turn-helix transcriptional regulator [Polyangiaceae bacterium]